MPKSFPVRHIEHPTKLLPVTFPELKPNADWLSLTLAMPAYFPDPSVTCYAVNHEKPPKTAFVIMLDKCYHLFISSEKRGKHSIFANAFINVLKNNQRALTGQEFFTQVRKGAIVKAKDLTFPQETEYN